MTLLRQTSLLKQTGLKKQTSLLTRTGLRNTGNRPVLGALSLDNTTPTQNQAVTINILGATVGSTITVQTGTLPTGLTLNSAARTITGTPTGTGLSSFTLREVLAGAANTPRDTALGITVQASIGTLVLPTNWTDFLTKYAAAAASGNVVDISVENNPTYTPSGNVEDLPINRAMTDLVLRGRGTAQMVRVPSCVANAKTEIVGWWITGDGGRALAAGNNGVDLRNGGSELTISGCTMSDSYNNLASPTGGCSDIYVRNTNNVRPRNDHNQFASGSAALAAVRMRFDNVRARDTVHAEHFWWYNNGTPAFYGPIDPGGTSGNIDGNHGDFIQVFTLDGATQSGGGDYAFNNCDVIVIGQAFQITDSLNTYNKFSISGGSYVSTLSAGINMSPCQNVTLIGPTFALKADHDPLFTAPQISLYPGAGQDGTYRGGQCIWPAATQASIIKGSSTTDFTAAVVNGTATLPSDPTFLGSASNVGNLNAARALPAYTDYAGPPVIVEDLQIVATGSAPYATNTWFTVYVPGILGFTYSPWIYDQIQTEWLIDGVSVQGPTTGLSGSVYRYTGSTGGVLTVRCRTGTGNPWKTIPAGVALAGGASGWNPADNGGGFALTGTNNKTATRTTTSVSNIRGVQGRTAGILYFEAPFTDLAFGDTDARLGIANAAAGLGSFQGNANVCHFNLSGNLGGNSTTLGTFAAQGDGTKFGICINFTTKKFYLRNAGGWLLGGDPDAAGAGIDISYLITGVSIFPWLQTTTTGDNSTIDTTTFTLGKPAVASAWG